MTDDIYEEMPEYLINFPADSDSIFELSDRHAAGIVLPDLDYESQFIAIQQLLQDHTKNRELHTRRIREIEEFANQTSGLRNEIAVNEWIGRIHETVFQDAAHSMAAVSMLAPFLESTFEQAFQGVRLRFHTVQGTHARWSDSNHDAWDPHFVWNKGRRSKNIIAGTMQLLEATEMLQFQPNDLQATLEGLFGYRNKMFHCGFEWPERERDKFSNRMSEWNEDWFVWSTRGGKPWICYMNDEFIEHCLGTIPKVFEGIGKFCKQELKKSWETSNSTQQ